MADVVPIRPTASYEAAELRRSAATAPSQLVKGLETLRSCAATMVEQLAGFEDLHRQLMRYDAAVTAGRLQGQEPIYLVTEGLDLGTLSELARCLSRQLDRLRVTAAGEEILAPVMVAGEDKGARK